MALKKRTKFNVFQSGVLRASTISKNRPDLFPSKTTSSRLSLSLFLIRYS